MSADQGDQPPADALVARAEVLLDLGRNDAAAATLARAIAADPSAARPHGLLARALARLSRLDESIDEADRAASLVPSDPWTHRMRSEVLLHAKAPKRALQAAEEAVRLGPAQAINHVFVAAAALQCKSRKRAQIAADRAVELAPNDVASQYVCGSVAAARHRWKEAEAAYRRALALDPMNWGATNDLGIALMRQHKTSEALDLFMSTAALNPKTHHGRQNTIRVAINSLHLQRRSRAVLLALACLGLVFGPPGAIAAATTLLLVTEGVYWARWAHLDPRARAAARDHLRTLSAGTRVARWLLIGFFMLAPVAILLAAGLSATTHETNNAWPLGLYGALLFLLYVSPHASLLRRTFGLTDQPSERRRPKPFGPPRG